MSSEAFFRPFERYAKTLLESALHANQVDSVDAYLDELRQRVIPDILRRLEPDESHYLDQGLGLAELDYSPQGEWERRMKWTFESFRIERPAQVESAMSDQHLFVWRFQLRLRFAEARLRFRSRIQNVLFRRLAKLKARALRCFARPHWQSGPRALRPGRRKWAGELANVKEQIREMRGSNLTHRQICARLKNQPRPPHAAWRDLSWPEALKKHPGAVKKWISCAART